MEKQTVTIEGESLEEIRRQIQLRVPNGQKVLSERIVSDGKPKVVRAVSDNAEKALLEARSKIPVGATILGEQTVSDAKKEIITVEDFDESAARSQVQTKIDNSEATIQTVNIASKGKRGILGIGKKPHRYEANIFYPAIVEVTYKTSAKISFSIGEPAEDVSVLVFILWAREAPPNPESYCRRILACNYPGAYLWCHYVVGFLNNLTVDRARYQYRKYVSYGQIQDLGKEIGSFEGNSPNGDNIVALFFSPKAQTGEARQGKATTEQDYVTNCLFEHYKEQDESRTWDSDPVFRKVLDPLNAGDNPAARDEAKVLSEKFPDFADVYVWWAKALLNDHRYNEAKTILRDALLKCKQKYPLLNLMGEVEWKSGSLSEAVHWWVQGLICQQTLKQFGQEEGAYLYLYYVADALGLSALAMQLRDRVDGIRPGQIRLAPDAAGSLTRLVRNSPTPEIRRALEMVEAKYFAPQPASGRSQSTEEISRLLTIAQNRDLDSNERDNALNRLAEVGDSTAIGPLMRLRNIESRGLDMIKFVIDETVERIRARSG